MNKAEPVAGDACATCGGDLWDFCEKCLRWGCYPCEFRPHTSREPVVCRACLRGPAKEIAMPKKPKGRKATHRAGTKSKPVRGLSSGPASVKRPVPKGIRATKGQGKQVCQPTPDLSTKPAPAQADLFPATAKAPVERPAAQKERVEIPPAPPQSVAPPAEAPIARHISEPPEGVFTAPFIEGSLAHTLTQPDLRVDRVVSRTFQKARYPWISEWTGASDAGDPCIRKLAYQRLYPEQALPDDGEMAFLFKHGQWVEKETYAEMAEAGYEIVEQQRPFHDRELMVKGKIDGKLILHHNGKRMRPPFEIKGYAPTTWNRVDSAKDILESSAGYLRKVPAQVMLYMVLDKDQDADAAILYMKNKLTGKPKVVVVPRDEAYASWLLKRLRVLHEYVVKKELPPRIEFDETVCGKCPFRGVCLQEMPPGVNNPVVLDPEKQGELHELLQDWWRLNPMRKEWEEADERIKSIVRGHPKIIIGDFIVTGTPGSQERVNSKVVNALPPEERAKYLMTIPTWRKGIVNVKDQNAGPKE
jgi:CRISPR/Cas system-associated exonuclease Cas4 (RecB family)